MAAALDADAEADTFGWLLLEEVALVGAEIAEAEAVDGGKMWLVVVAGSEGVEVPTERTNRPCSNGGKKGSLEGVAIEELGAGGEAAAAL